MFKELKELFDKYTSLSLYDLSLYFDMDKEAMEQMLAMWVAKKKIVKKDLMCSTGACAGCIKTACDISKMVVYQKASCQC